MRIQVVLAVSLAVSAIPVTYGQVPECTLDTFRVVGLGCAQTLIEGAVVNLEEIGKLIRLDLFVLLDEIGLSVTNPNKPSDICFVNCTLDGCNCDAVNEYLADYDVDSYDFFAAIQSGVASGKFSGRKALDAVSKYEPMLAYLVGSVYKTFLKGNEKNIVIPGVEIDLNPYIGNLTGVESLYLTSLTHYCSAVAPALTTCLKTGFTLSSCGSATWDLWSPYMSLLETRYCDGTSVKTSVKNTFSNNIDSLFREAECIFTNNPMQIELDETHLESIYEKIESSVDNLEKCNLGPQFERLLTPLVKWYETDVMPILDELDVLSLNMNPLLSVLKDPGPVTRMMTDMEGILRCMMPEIEPLQDGICRSPNDPLVLKTKFGEIMTMLKTALPLEPFMSKVQNWDIWGKERVNPASRERASMWVVGDPHIRPVGANSFTTCESKGLTIFYSNDLVKFSGYNEPACDGGSCVATYLKNLTIEFFNAEDLEDTVANATYFTEGENPATTFTDGSVDIQTGKGSVYLEYTINKKTVFITDENSGTMFAIRPWKYINNVVMRTSKGIAVNSIGILVSGCDSPATDIEQTRKKRATSEECVAACANSPALMRDECAYDCDILDDPDIGTGSYDTIEEVEAAVVVRDDDVIALIPDAYTVYEAPTTLPGGTGVDLRASLVLSSLLLAALALLL